MNLHNPFSLLGDPVENTDKLIGYTDINTDELLKIRDSMYPLSYNISRVKSYGF